MSEQDKIVELKKKQKVLKAALLQERELRKKVQEELEMAMKKCSSFEQRLQDAESSASYLAQENDKLRNEISELSYKNERLTEAQNKLKEGGGGGKKKSAQAENKFLVESQNLLEMEYQKLETNYSCLKDEKEELKAALALAQQSLIKKQSQFLTVQESLRSRINTLNLSLQDTESQIGAERVRADQALVDLAQHQESLQNRSSEMEQLKKKKKELQAEVLRLQDANTGQKDAIAQLYSSLDKAQKETSQLADKLVLLKGQMLDSNSPFKTFQVQRIGLLRAVPTSLNLRKNEDEEYVLETTLNGKVQSINVVDVDGVRQKEKNTFEIEIIGLGGKKETYLFESRETADIVKTFKQFEMKAASQDVPHNL